VLIEILNTNYQIHFKIFLKIFFNVQTMKQDLLSFKIDLTKMPLGKLSKNQLNKAYKILTELQTLIINGTTTFKTVTINVNNRFYTRKDLNIILK